MRLSAIRLLLLMVPGLALAQDPAAAARTERARAALAPLSKILGQWQGSATAMMGPSQTMQINQHEDVVAGAGGTVFFIRGTGRGTEGATAGSIVFEAAALIWFDGEQNRLRMTSHRDGRSVDAELEIQPDTLVWGFPVPGGRVRYTLALSERTWHEVGHFLRAGAAPIPIIEMRLDRLPRP